MVIENVSNNLVIENSIDLIKVTIRGNKKWGWFLLSFITFIVNGFCILPILCLATISIVQKFLLTQQYLSAALQVIVLVVVLILFMCLYLIILYRKFPEAIEFLFDSEIIQISEQSISIERSGFLGFRTKKVFLAENIKGLVISSPITEQLGFLNRSPFVSTNIGAFMVWHGRGFKRFYNFGRNVSQLDAQNLIATVYRKFPKYIYSSTP
jgi:hypothetical protein